MYLILFVLHNPDQLDDILHAWEACGVSGITLLPSTGLRRLRSSAALRDDLPLIPSLSDLLSPEQDLNRTLFTVVPDEASVDQVVAATQEVTGDLDEPDTGILVVLPVARAYGLNRKRSV